MDRLWPRHHGDFKTRLLGPPLFYHGFQGLGVAYRVVFGVEKQGWDGNGLLSEVLDQFVVRALGDLVGDVVVDIDGLEDHAAERFIVGEYLREGYKIIFKSVNFFIGSVIKSLFIILIHITHTCIHMSHPYTHIINYRDQYQYCFTVLHHEEQMLWPLTSRQYVTSSCTLYTT